MNNLSDFQRFFQIYPRPTGEGAARRAFINQIMFHAADPEQMISAAKVFREKKSDTKIDFIPYPARWLEDECYKDADLQKPAEVELTGWRAKLADMLGANVVQAWLADASFEDGVLTLHNGRDGYSGSVTKVN